MDVALYLRKSRADEDAAREGETLAKHKAALLALDLAIDREGKIYVLEVNPKPAREVFARSGNSGTYHKALVRPLEYALWMYKNKNTPSSAKTTEE